MRFRPSKPGQQVSTTVTRRGGLTWVRCLFLFVTWGGVKTFMSAKKVSYICYAIVKVLISRDHCGHSSYASQMY